MKRLKSLFLISGILLAAAVLFGCKGSPKTAKAEVEPGAVGAADPNLVVASEIAKQIDPEGNSVIVFYSRSDKSYSKWGLWVWDHPGGKGEAGYDATAGRATVKNGIAYWNVSILTSDVSAVQTAISDGGKLGLIIRDTGWNKDPGPDQILDLTTGARHFMVLSGDTTVYTIKESFAPTIVSAVCESKNRIKVGLSVNYGLDTSVGSSGFVVKDADGNVIPVSDSVNYEAQSDRSKNNARAVLLTTAQDLVLGKEYFVSHPSFEPAKGVLADSIGLIKDAKVYDGNDLGLTLDGSRATFKAWIPSAKSVQLHLYSSVSDVGDFEAGAVSAKSVGSLTSGTLKGTPSKTVPMVKNAENNVWSYQMDDVSAYRYYKYEVLNGSDTYYVSDIWGKSCSPEAIASQIVDINKSSDAMPAGSSKTYGTKAGYVNPFGNSGAAAKSYSDAVVYEMHVTDWSYAEDGDISSNVGKYLTIANGSKVISHVKDMGVTHVQILPVFEFAETNANTKYNWGYNPYHYNVPEGRYVTSGYSDGSQAVKELRTLIEKFHEAGISVIMDVVYNHTSGTGAGSLYDSTIPSYFYRFDSSGAYSNGSGCGNEVDTEVAMSKKYIIDSLKHWMLDYHFNGFRFDLMGCMSKETMTDIYNALYEIDRNVLVYGEPWTGGDAMVSNGAVQAVSTSVGYGVGAFDDDFRDSVKGAEFGGFKRGHVQDANSDSGVVLGLKGKSGNNKRNATEVVGLRINYVECHDNYTLADKLAISRWQVYKGKKENETSSGDLFNEARIGPDGLAIIKAQDKLAASYVFLAQGMAFMNGGQEFLRTKRGNENSYNASNASSYTTNGINLEMKNTHADVYNTYKGLIALRQSDTAAFGGNKNAKATTVSKGVTRYETGDYCIYFNASDDESAVNASGYSKSVDVSTGAPVESATVPAKVSAKSFVILKK